MPEVFRGAQLGYTGSYLAVRPYARGREQRAGVATSDAFVPLSFAPGEAYQFDWSHDSDFAVINGVTMTLKIAHVRLSYSWMPIIRAYPRETQEAARLTRPQDGRDARCSMRMTAPLPSSKAPANVGSMII